MHAIHLLSQYTVRILCFSLSLSLSLSLSSRARAHVHDASYIYSYTTSIIIAAATFGSFLIALFHFSIEVFVYNTVSVRSAIQPMIIASISSLWMGAGWNYYTSYVSSAPAYVYSLCVYPHGMNDHDKTMTMTCRVSEETQVTHTDKTD